LLSGLDGAFPSSRKIGGLASGARKAGDTALYQGNVTYRSGLVGVAMRGDIEVEAVVAQGCRPIGDPMFVTRASDDILQELDGQPPLDMLGNVYQHLDHTTRNLRPIRCSWGSRCAIPAKNIIRAIF
jgi:small ligand-binding sensory domain FIST